MTEPICRDLNALLPCFRERIVVLLERLRAAGWNVQVWETYRSPARVKMLAAKGTGSTRSVHPYGVAIDIVENDKTPWTLARPGLWEAIAEEAEALGLTAGLRFKRHDGPHIQALPARFDSQVAKVSRELSFMARDRWVRARMMPPRR